MPQNYTISARRLTNPEDISKFREAEQAYTAKDGSLWLIAWSGATPEFIKTRDKFKLDRKRLTSMIESDTHAAEIKINYNYEETEHKRTQDSSDWLNLG